MRNNTNHLSENVYQRITKKGKSRQTKRTQDRQRASGLGLANGNNTTQIYADLELNLHKTFPRNTLYYRQSENIGFAVYSLNVLCVSLSKVQIR